MEKESLIREIYYHVIQEPYQESGKENRVNLAKGIEEFQETLNEEQSKNFQKILDLWLTSENDSTEDAFELGFHTGFKLAMEVSNHGN
ncbi:MAG: hypothetical protein R3Y63_09490 [Eubacteriales bacterium]